MSLKDFHVIFIVCSIVLSTIFGAWAMNRFQQLGGGSYLATAVGSFLLALGLVGYIILFLKKLKNVE